MVKIIYSSILIYNRQIILKVGIYLFVKTFNMVITLFTNIIFVNKELKDDRIQSDLYLEFPESLCDFFFQGILNIFICSYSIFFTLLLFWSL